MTFTVSRSPRKLAGYLGLDPRVRQSGVSARDARAHLKARLHQGASRAGRGVLDDGPPARSRCTPSISASEHAAVTLSRSSPPPESSLACSGVCSPAKQDYAYQQPSLTRKKLRRLQITAGAKRYTPEAAGIYSANDAVRDAERELARQAEVAYARTVSDWHATQAVKVGASVTPGRASKKPIKGEAARQTTSP